MAGPTEEASVLPENPEAEGVLDRILYYLPR